MANTCTERLLVEELTQGVFAGRGPAVHAHRPDVPATAVQIVPKSFMSVQLSPLLQTPAQHMTTFSLQQSQKSVAAGESMRS